MRPDARYVPSLARASGGGIRFCGILRGMERASVDWQRPDCFAIGFSDGRFAPLKTRIRAFGCADLRRGVSGGISGVFILALKKGVTGHILLNVK